MAGMASDPVLGGLHSDLSIGTTHMGCAPALCSTSQKVHILWVQNLLSSMSISLPKPGLACVSTLTLCLGKEPQETDKAIGLSCSPWDASRVPSPPEALPSSPPRRKQHQQVLDRLAFLEILIGVGSSLANANIPPSASIQ